VIQRTLTIVKPDAVRAGVQGHILQCLLDEGFRIVAMRQARLSRTEAEGFYAVHRQKPFFGELVEFMTSGPVVVACLEREDAVVHLRKVMGPTDSRKAPPETLRGRFGTGLQENAVHGSDSPENAALETAYFFTAAELGSGPPSPGSAAAPPPAAAPTLERPPRERGRL